MPEFSVVIPSYNHSAYISKAVQSVLEQTLPDLELIVVDDGSTDDSREILAGFSDQRLRVVHQENQGAHAAINRGLREAAGNFLAILNSDDTFHSERLEKAQAVFGIQPSVGLISSQIKIIDQDGAQIGIKHGFQDCSPWELGSPENSFRAGEDLRAALLTENFLATTSNYVFSRQLFEQVGDFLPLRYTHDWDFALRSLHYGELHLIPEPLMSYRVHGSNTIRENQAAMVFEICWILAVHLPQAISTSWFLSAGGDKRTRQLLNSIYTYDCERVLNVMLLHKLYENQSLALELLFPDNPLRLEYLQYIDHQFSALPIFSETLSTNLLSKLKKGSKKVLNVFNKKF